MPPRRKSKPKTVAPAVAAASYAWSFDDEHLHWILAPAPAVHLLRLAAVGKQWCAVVGELMRIRDRDDREQEWSAAMACRPHKDFSSKPKAKLATAELIGRTTRHALKSLRMVPDLAIVFAS